MKVYVSLKDIENGVPVSDNSCPYANGLRRKLKLPASRVSVTSESVKIFSKRGNITRQFKPSLKLADAIDNYDSNWDFKPGHYSMREVNKNADLYLAN